MVKDVTHSPSDMLSLLATLSVPTVFSGMTESWPAHTWTIDSLSNLLGDEWLEYKFGKRDANYNLENQCKFEVGSLAGFCRWLKGESHDDASEEKDYFWEFPRKEYWGYADYNHFNDLDLCSEPFRQLQKKLGGKPLVDWSVFGFRGRDERTSTLWCGSEGAFTPCHYDCYGVNLVAQIYGRKKWVLFEPDSTIHPEVSPLYPSRIPYEESTVFSQVYIPLPESNTQRLFKNARRYEVTLNPGEVLFVPRHWWHYVECLEPAISINTWLELEDDCRARVGEATVESLIRAHSQTVLSKSDSSLQDMWCQIHDNHSRAKVGNEPLSSADTLYTQQGGVGISLWYEALTRCKENTELTSSTLRSSNIVNRFTKDVLNGSVKKGAGGETTVSSHDSSLLNGTYRKVMFIEPQECASRKRNCLTAGRLESSTAGAEGSSSPEAKRLCEGIPLSDLQRIVGDTVTMETEGNNANYGGEERNRCCKCDCHLVSENSFSADKTPVVITTAGKTPVAMTSADLPSAEHARKKCMTKVPELNPSYPLKAEGQAKGQAKSQSELKTEGQAGGNTERNTKAYAAVTDTNAALLCERQTAVPEGDITASKPVPSDKQPSAEYIQSSDSRISSSNLNEQVKEPVPNEQYTSNEQSPSTAELLERNLRFLHYVTHPRVVEVMVDLMLQEDTGLKRKFDSK